MIAAGAAVLGFIKSPIAPWIVVAAVAAWGFYERSDASDARADKAAYRAEIAERIAANNARVVEHLEILGAKADEATARDVARDRAAKQATATTLSGIDNAPSSADGPVAPVVRDALRSMRGR